MPEGDQRGNLGRAIEGGAERQRFRLADVLWERELRVHPGHHNARSAELDDRTDARVLVCVIDDELRVRDSLGNLLSSAGYDVELHSSPADFLAAPRTVEPGCLVLDIRLKAESGLDFQRRLFDAGVRIPVVLMTAHGDIPMTVRGMRQGAIDFLPKPFRAEDMLSAVSAAIRLHRAQRLEERTSAELETRFAGLSAREREVMALVASGLMNKQVAAELAISEVTVKIHRGNVMRKMAASSLADLVRMAELLGIRDPRVGRFKTKS